MSTKNKICIVVGASHAGVNFAFSLRQEGWEGQILVFDADPEVPYHRPPLSKTYLTAKDHLPRSLLFPEENYTSDNIELNLGKRVLAIYKDAKQISLEDGTKHRYDYLVIATGARPLIPPIPRINEVKNMFTMRTLEDTLNIRRAINSSKNKRVVIIGGGYIGLETAASLKKLGADVKVLERESRILARVTAPVMSDFFTDYHTKKGVEILTDKNVVCVDEHENAIFISCEDGTSYLADMVVLGVGIVVNTELAASAGLLIENGIRVDARARTNDEAIYAIGDCTNHFNPHYQTYVRLESVQNAVDQAKIAAASICGKDVEYDTIPWFWSDQFDLKLQMVGLSKGYDELVRREEKSENTSFSVWYFKGEELLAVDAVNNAKAYMLGTRYIKTGCKIDRAQLIDPSMPIKMNSFLSS